VNGGIGMKKVLGWTLAIVLGLVVLLGLGALFLGRMLPYGYRGMMGERGMMPWGYSHMVPFGGGLMFLGWLIPAGLLILAIIGIVMLVNSLSRPKSLTTPVVTAPVVLEHKCAQCGKPLQADWTVCAFCGTPVTPIVEERKCAECGKPAQPDWTTCPYCGTPLS
jgi:hypothetical protein